MKVPKAGDMNHSPSSENPYQGEISKALVQCHLKSYHSQVCGNFGKSIHANINVDNNNHYGAFEDAYLPEEFTNLATNISTVSLEQCDEDFIRPNADLEPGMWGQQCSSPVFG